MENQIELIFVKWVLIEKGTLPMVTKLRRVSDEEEAEKKDEE